MFDLPPFESSILASEILISLLAVKETVYSDLIKVKISTACQLAVIIPTLLIIFAEYFILAAYLHTFVSWYICPRKLQFS